MIQVNRIYLIFNRLVTKKFLVDTSVGKYISVDLLEVLLLLKVKNMDFLVEFLSKAFLKVKEQK